MNSLELSSVARWGLSLLAMLAFIVALRLGAVIFIPTIIALILAAMLWPVVRWLNQWLPWGVTCLLVVVSTILPIVIVTAGFSVAIPRMLQGLPDPRNPEGQKELYSDIRKQVERLSPTFLDEVYWPVEAEKSAVFKSVEATLQNKYVQDTMLRFMPDALFRVATFGIDWVCQWVLILFQLLFLLLEGRMLTRRVAELVGPTADLQARAVSALADMAFQVRNFLLWRTLVNIGLGLIVGGVYHVLGLREPWTWALLTMVLCYVPCLGPIVAGVPPIFDAF
ncbi:MAG TPA: AI-2E family transporter, partial [Isosphaeraceae bacterium]|nr:AI-2E family transporter [Isosphaeraceae bacterium]